MITGKKMNTKTPAQRIPVVSAAYAGSPLPDEWQNWQIKKFRDIRRIEHLSPFDRVIGFPVAGDSLNSIGIIHGDILITRLTAEYKPERLGVWQTPHGQTAKFASENFDGTVTLHNQNGWFQTWEAADVKLIGLVVRVERDYE